MHRQTKRSRARAVGAVAALIGGAATVIGTLLTWIHSQGVSVATVSVPGDVRGLETPLGWLCLGAGGFAVALSLIALLGRRRAGRVLGLVTILAGLVVAVVVAVYLRDPEQGYIDFAVSRAQDAGIATEGVDASLRQLIQVSSLTVDVELGAWIAAGGAALVLIGGGLITASGALRRDVDAYEIPALLEHDASHPDESVLGAPPVAAAAPEEMPEGAPEREAPGGEEVIEPGEPVSEPEDAQHEAREEEPQEPEKKEPPDDVAMWRI